MSTSAQVRIFECGGGKRRYVRTISIEDFLRHAVGRLPALEVEQFRNDLAVNGRATIRGSFGKSYEYETVATTQLR